MIKKTTLGLLIAVLLIPAFAKADGGLIPPPGFYVYETGQKGIILFDKKTNQETLVLSTTFQGEADEFSWIIPTPSKPEVTKISKEIFTNLAELTQSKDYSIQPLSSFGTANLKEVDSGVTVVEQKTIGYYDVAVLEATSKNALYDWLKENGYWYPAKGKYILDDYINNSWFFTAVKISKEAQGSGVDEKLSSGEIAPVKLVFSTQNIVYPLKISAIGQYYESDQTSNNYSNSEMKIAPGYFPSSTPITLYIFSNHKKNITGFDIQYANWISEKDIEGLASDDNGNNWIDAKGRYYLTKLSQNTTYSQMDSDLFPKDADNNKKVGVIAWYVGLVRVLLSWLYPLIVFVLSILFFVGAYFQLTWKQSRFWWILQSVSFASTLFATGFLVFIVLETMYSSYSGYYGMIDLEGALIFSFLTALIGIVLGIELFVLMLQKFIHKNSLIEKIKKL